MRYEAWSDGSFFPANNKSAYRLLEEGAYLIWAVEADSWKEALELYDKWRGWK